MARKGNFSSKTIATLADRAGNKCSYPNCGNPTNGPSAESEISVAKTGMACHIYAATDGRAARRVNKEMSAGQLSHISNGIWLCYTHGKLIDTDECTYEPELLQDWRIIAERKAQLRQRYGEDIEAWKVDELPLAKLSLKVSQPNPLAEINKAIELSCIAESWGNSTALALRDVAIELGRNALTHGESSNFQMVVKSNFVELIDDGFHFSHRDLISTKNRRGGAMALEVHGGSSSHILLSYMRRDDCNVTTIVPMDRANILMGANACSVTLEYGPQAAAYAAQFIERHTQCGTIFIHPIHGIIGFSDLGALSAQLNKCDLSGRDVAIVLDEHSEEMYKQIRNVIPQIRIIVVNRRG